MIRSAAFILCGALLAVVMGCEKVPLREHRGQFDLATAHWFENEKTQYLFFSIEGLRTGQAKVSWPAEFEMAKDGGEFKRINFSEGVHQHHLVECGEGKICGSFSFKADTAATRVQIRYRYNVESPLAETITVPTSQHRANSGTNAQSALVYGVFNGANSRVQVRVHDNFGSPDSEQIKQYGMTRRFEVASTSLADLATFTAADLSVGNPFHFPSRECEPFVAGTPHDSWQFSGLEGWEQKEFDSSKPESSACFRVKTLNRAGVALNEAPALARRNPELGTEALSIRSPLQDSIKVPLAFGYCLDRPDSAKLTSLEFLNYQRFILGMAAKGDFDACFAVGEEEDFALKVDRVIKEKLQFARQTATSKRDFFFTVLINHRLAPEIDKFQEIIADKLAEAIRAETATMISPRLVGGFVYDSRAPEARIASRSPQVVWCPRIEKPDSPTANADANCTPRRAGQVAIGPLNFLIPMGPFPTLDTYIQYVRENGGDRGQSRNPQLAVRSVQTNENSMSDPEGVNLFTFFDGQRLSFNESERLRFCFDRDQDLTLQQLVFKKGDARSPNQVFDVNTAQRMASSGSAASLDVGLRWSNPFIGGFTFESPIEGKVLSFIPISASLPGKQKIGDDVWARKNWDIGPLLQKCFRHCDHPYFDEAGVYQINRSWSEDVRCPTPKTAEPNT